MTEARWAAVDDYFNALLLPNDEVLTAALEACAAAGMPPISVSPTQGKWLELLARSCGARTILEVGTLGGYSAIWLARALPPGGQLVTIELDPGHAAVARANLERAGLSDVVEVRVGRALDELPKLEASGRRPFDLVFIDADKPNNPEYFAWALRLARPGSIIVVDNVVRGGSVVDADTTDPKVRGARRLCELIAS